jgi:hypothetical protein
VVLAALLAGSFVALSPTAMARACGVERWREKTLTDTRAGRIKLTPRTTTVDALRRKKVVRDPQGLRASGVETAVYRVRAQLIGFKREDDGDIHLVISSLESRSRTMIVEFPDSTCTKGARQSLRRRMSRAKSRLQHACGVPSASFARLQGTATFSGVGFFDFIHGQTGVAPNGIELHPVLSVGGDDLATCARAV